MDLVGSNADNDPKDDEDFDDEEPFDEFDEDDEEFDDDLHEDKDDADDSEDDLGLGIRPLHLRLSVHSGSRRAGQGSNTTCPCCRPSCISYTC